MTDVFEGWLLSVFECIEKIGRPEFTLADAYAFEAHLNRLYPMNQHIRPKIRQQLRVLRDPGVLEFRGPGRYKLLRSRPTAVPASVNPAWGLTEGSQQRSEHVSLAAGGRGYGDPAKAKTNMERVMASATKAKQSTNCVQLTYQLLRNTTSPDEKVEGVQSFIANLPAREILKIDTRDNLRSYLAEYNPRKRNRVHDAIRETIINEPQRFIVRNSGFVITCADIEVNDQHKTVTLREGSVINGAQSQGEIRAYFREFDDDGPTDVDDAFFHVRATIIVDPDPDEVVETAIARNIVTPVKSLSEAGARSQLEELEQSIKKVIPGAKIRKNESQSGDEFIDTRQVLQLARLLMPMEVSGNSSAAEKLRAYKNPEQCLTDFCDWEANQGDPLKKSKYVFTVEIAPYALQEYERWERHPAWNGHKIWSETKKGGRAVKRDRKTNKIIWVSPGLIFPLIGAMSEFASRATGKWRLAKPARFKEDEMILRTVNQFRAHNSDPMLMGRSEAAYDALRIYPQTLVEVLRDIEENR